MYVSFKLSADDINEKLIPNIKKTGNIIRLEKTLVFKKYDVVITIYSNHTILLNGGSKDIIKLINENFIIYKSFLNYIKMAGADEVGTGDIFGPIVTTAVWIKPYNLLNVLLLNPKDTKQLTDVQIINLAKKIEPLVEYAHTVVENYEYNSLVNKNINLNEIKAIMHNSSILKLQEKMKKYNHFSDQKIILDQFVSEKKYNQYLLNNNINLLPEIKIVFQTKAENSYLAVACAAILARKKMLDWFDKNSKKLNIKLPFGAGNNAVSCAERVLKLGIDLNTIAKTNFKNIRNLIDK